MSTIATATVEVLTAEVRVLMVGSRQVTLSVFRQLDRVEWDKCEPFGRVRDSRDGYYEKEIIGKHTDTGQLVRSDFSDLWPGGVPRWTQEDEAKLTEANRNLASKTQSLEHYETRIEEQEIFPNGDDMGWYRKCADDARKEIAGLKNRISNLEMAKSQIPDVKKQYETDLTAFKALPLIVLAGLK